jgi:hypothetical protein
MLQFGAFQGCLRLVDGPLAALAFLLPSGLFLPALTFTTPLLPLERQCGLAICFVVNRAGPLLPWLGTSLLGFVAVAAGQVSRQFGVFPEVPTVELRRGVNARASIAA